MPSQQRVGRRDRGDLAQGAATDTDGAAGEASPVGVRQPNPSRPELSMEQTVLNHQVGDDVAFAALEPARENQEQLLKSLGVTHERQLISRVHQIDRMLKPGWSPETRRNFRPLRKLEDRLDEEIGR